ncbi:Mg-dependent DNase [Mycena floridula]|nr:Mg-dependent DNase [Mycena floridula]
MPIVVVPSQPAVVRNLRFIDIGANLTDLAFTGEGRRKHENDFAAMLERSAAAGVKSSIITGTSLTDSKSALNVAKQHSAARLNNSSSCGPELFATVGCHPTRTSEFDKFRGGPSAYLQGLDRLIQDNLTGKGRVVAIGECGLDYDRLHFADEATQRKHFRSQLSLAKKYHLPLFLHCRASHNDFVTILREEGFGEDGGKAVGGAGGVVHSFTGTETEVVELMDMGFYISVNGCSMKTKENLKMCKAIRPEKILLETDAPWCSLTSTHASHAHLASLPPDLRSLYFPPSVKPENFQYGKAIKGRNEPCACGAVAWVIHKIHEVPLEKVTEKAWKNTIELFRLQSDLQ